MLVLISFHPQGLEEYPYTKVVKGAEGKEGVRASITLYDAADQPQALLYFLNDDYLAASGFYEYVAKEGRGLHDTNGPDVRPSM